jgi:hypothetical protein
MSRYISGAAISALALVLAGPVQADIGTPAGVAGAVSGSVGLTSPAKQIITPVAVRSGDGIVMGDNLATGADSRLQVMLLDESAITLGPDAELTIDEFVFDPASTNQDLLAATLLKGAFRLVTGGVARQNPDGTTLNLPNAVLTIRGTTVIGACAAGCVVALAGSGDANSAGKKPSAATIKTPKGEVTLKRAGFYVEIDAEGNISPPARLTEPVEERFAQLFPGTGDMGALQRAAFIPQGRDLLEQSGQPAQEGRPLAVNQRDFDEAEQLDGNDLFETTTNLPVQRINYQSNAIAFSGGSGDGDYYVSYSLDLAARNFAGSVFVDHQDNSFQTTIPLTLDPFKHGLSLVESGPVLDPTLPNDVYQFIYTIGSGGMQTTFNYDEDGPGTAPVSTGSGLVPVVP